MKCTNVLIDSGAFSAWQGGVAISLTDYIDYCKRHKNEAASYINLDYIPGKDGVMDRSREAVEDSAARSFNNLLAMKDAGLHPMPVFHQGERFYWLERMLEEGETYIGIAPYKRDHQSSIIKWMDQVFTIITDKTGRPLIKTHGLGVTACNFCMRYPWTSVDSTSWSIGGGYGTILVPHYKDDEPDYSRPPINLRLSARKQDQSKGFDGLTDIQQNAVRKAVADAGISMSELRNTFMGRWRFNVRYYKGMAEACNGRLFKNRANSLFGSFAPNGKGFDPKPMQLYLATVLHTNHHNEFLNEQNIQNRLLSYAFLKDLPDDFLAMYRETGLPEFKAKRPRKMTIKMLSSEVYRVRRAIAIKDRLARAE
jgi:hypothetical protein